VIRAVIASGIAIFGPLGWAEPWPNYCNVTYASQWAWHLVGAWCFVGWPHLMYLNWNGTPMVLVRPD
jgi:hypothetical protein